MGERQPSSFQGINRLKSHEVLSTAVTLSKKISIVKKAVSIKKL